MYRENAQSRLNVVNQPGGPLPAKSAGGHFVFIEFATLLNTREASADYFVINRARRFISSER